MWEMIKRAVLVMTLLIILALPAQAGYVWGYGSDAFWIGVDKGVTTFHLKYNADEEVSNFIVRLWDTEKDRSWSLANEIGSCEVYQTISIPRGDSYVLNIVHAKGDWAIEWYK